MEIRATYNNKVYRFEDIKQGECFIDCEGDLMMKVEEYASGNAVSIINGCIYTYDDADIVTPVKATLEYER